MLVNIIYNRPKVPRPVSPMVVMNESVIGGPILTDHHLRPTRVTNTSVFGSPTVRVSKRYVSPARVTNTSVIGGNAVIRIGSLATTRVVNTSQFGGHAIVNTKRYLLATAVQNTSTFGADTVSNITPNPPTLDGVANGSNTSTTCTVSLTTANAGDIICVAVLCNGGPVTGISGGGLIWTRRARNVATSFNCELWSAQAVGALTGVNITVTQTSSAFLAVTAFGVSGAKGWDTNGALPSLIGDGSGNSTTDRCSITTSKSADFLIGVYRFHFTSAPTSPGTGWTFVSSGNFMEVEYKTVTVTQTATDVLLSTGFNGGSDDQNGGIGDALTANNL